METISVIISTKDRARELVRCLGSISAQTRLPHEVIVVDSSDKGNLKEELTAFDDLNIKYVRSKVGLTLQRNIGIRTSSRDVIIFLDDDLTLDRDYVKEIMHVFERYPAGLVGGVTGKIVNKEGEEKLRQRFCRFLEEIFATLFLLVRHGNGRFQLSGFPTVIRRGTANKVRDVEFLYGCNMAFRKEVISRFEFDENLCGYSWGEDDDIAFRVSREYQNILTPFARLILNRVAPSTGGSRYAVMKMMMENHYYLFKKNLPQDFGHRVSFYWSVLGLFIREGITTLIKQDGDGLKGLASGIQTIMVGMRR